jgi:hypothetical protein
MILNMTNNYCNNCGNHFYTECICICTKCNTKICINCTNETNFYNLYSNICKKINKRPFPKYLIELLDNYFPTNLDEQFWRNINDTIIKNYVCQKCNET